MNTPSTDVVDLLAGIVPGSHLEGVRAARPQARIHAQKSFEALLAPVEPGVFSVLHRHVVAAFVAGLHRDKITADFYATRVASLAVDNRLTEVVAEEIASGLAHGPYGRFPAGPLTSEDVPGPVYRVGSASRRQLDASLTAALEHAHLLVYHPRDASPEALKVLLDSGWTTNAVVTLSQLVAFLSFQIRVIAGLRTLAA